MSLINDRVDFVSCYQILVVAHNIVADGKLEYNSLTHTHFSPFLNKVGITKEIFFLVST